MRYHWFVKVVYKVYDYQYVVKYLVWLWVVVSGFCIPEHLSDCCFLLFKTSCCNHNFEYYLCTSFYPCHIFYYFLSIKVVQYNTYA